METASIFICEQYTRWPKQGYILAFARLIIEEGKPIRWYISRYSDEVIPKHNVHDFILTQEILWGYVRVDDIHHCAPVTRKQWEKVKNGYVVPDYKYSLQGGRYVVPTAI